MERSKVTQAIVLTVAEFVHCLLEQMGICGLCRQAVDAVTPETIGAPCPFCGAEDSGMGIGIAYGIGLISLERDENEVTSFSIGI